jgi:hypothetical protein
VPPSLPPSGDVHWPTYAELHSALSGLLDAAEKRIVQRIDEKNETIRDLEKRLRASELSVSRLQTVGAVLWGLSTVIGPLVVGWVMRH